METGPQIWEGGGGGGRHSRSNSNIQPPWECDLSAATASTTPTAGGDHHSLDASSPSQHHRSSSNGGRGGYGNGGASYLDGSSLPPSPLETLYRRTASFSNSRSLSTSPANQEDPSVSSSARRHHHHHGRSTSISGFPGGEGGRRQSLSGPLPSPEDHPPMALYRRPSLSGPLPFSSQHNPYNISSPTFDNEIIPPLKTPSPWSGYHLNNNSAAASPNGGGLSNPYLNPFSPNGSMSMSSNSFSATSLPRPPSHQYSNGNDSSPSIASPNSVGNGYTNNSHNVDISSRGPPVRQLYGYSNGSTDPFAALVASSSPSSPTTGEQWASFPTNNSQKSLNGRPLASGLSQRTHGPASLSATGRSPGNSMNGGTENGVGPRGVSPNLTRSKSVHNGAFQGSNGTGGVLPFNTRGTLNRSVSCSGAEEMARKYSKGRGGLGEGVVETLVAQLVFAKEKPSMLADMIFCPSKLSRNTVLNSKGPFAYARDLVERILHAQAHALTPSFKDMAQFKSGEFEDAIWALSMFKNGKVQERFPNEGYRLLRLQTQFVEAGLETFDMLCRVRKQFPALMAGDDKREGGANNAGLLRIACFGGGPGCEALAIRLFFMRLLPTQLQLQVDIFDRRERWKEIVDNISLKGVGLLNVDLFDVIFHPTWLRSYRLLVFIDYLGKGFMSGNNSNARRTQNWAEFWSNLFRNTSPGVVVIILEKSCPWEEMRPKKGSNWWCSALAEQELVHVARKII